MTTTTTSRGIGGVVQRSIRGRAKGGETSPRAMIFLVALWFCLLFALLFLTCLLYTSPSPRDGLLSRMPSSA